MTPEQIIAAARECIGTPFAHQGRILGRALDCAGVAVHAASRWHTADEPAAYGRLPNNSMLETWLERQPFLLRADSPLPGDLLLMRFSGDPQHLAICAGDTIIHAYEAAGKVVEHNLDDKWRRRIARVYRFSGVRT
jgi:cell wall-associated NlpC family hydrolase